MTHRIGHNAMWNTHTHTEAHSLLDSTIRIDFLVLLLLFAALHPRQLRHCAAAVDVAAAALGICFIFTFSVQDDDDAVNCFCARRI